MKPDFSTFVLNPTGSCDATWAIAACRAGALGVLNVDLVEDDEAIHRQLKHLAASTRSGFGLKIDRLSAARLEAVQAFGVLGLERLIVDTASVSVHREALSQLRQQGIEVIAEFSQGNGFGPTCSSADFDGVMVKGNEASGFVGEHSAFILFQRWRQLTNLPIYVRGGVTPHVAAGCAALGAAGVVLESQLLLLKESPLTSRLDRLIRSLSGSETVAVGHSERSEYFRLLARPDCPKAMDFVRRFEDAPKAEWQADLAEQIDWQEPRSGLLPIGQDVAFARDWRERYGTLRRVVQAIETACETYPDWVHQAGPLSQSSALSADLGTRFPIVQGPMTRVSDKAHFADLVSAGGALPMLALALLRGESLRSTLESTAEALGERPWGVGLLGFAPLDLLEEQIEEATRHKPAFAIVAGGRPDQAAQLEAKGIRSFLHVPSAGLLSQFVSEGARRFIFEGRECGGHIGPLSSFVLWSVMVDTLSDEIDRGRVEAKSLRILFAGGIHDETSSAMVQMIAAPLTSRGVHIGILMGSGYLFCREIVESGAVVPGFQRTMIDCEETVRLVTGPGHASCCARSPFTEDFFQERRRQREEDVPLEDRRERLDDLVLGRLRVASKGLQRDSSQASLVQVAQAEQLKSGMYMAGQVVTLRNQETTIVDLHRAVLEGASDLLPAPRMRPVPVSQGSQPAADVAIVGIASYLPGAPDHRALWENILSNADAVTEIPTHRWDWRLYFDEDRERPDKVYSKWGGFLEDLPFDPVAYGIPPKAVESVDPMQLMALEVAYRTLEDAGYADVDFDRSRASVILGASGGVGDVGLQYGLRAEWPRFAGELPREVANRLPEWTEDSFAGILINVLAGRIANRLDFKGANFTVDAACASSLAAIHQAASDLQAGRSDFVLAGGVDTVQGPFGYLCFAKTQALSPRGQCRSFDSSADGIVISEGVAMVALKRLADAERDGDRIYSVIKGISGGSDGRVKGLTAPYPEGQVAAMQGAYAQAGFSPNSVELFEAHGTGTVAGDAAELESTAHLLRDCESAPRNAVMGSLKTNIGHTKATAGVAGLVKASLALHHRVLPPQRHIDQPNQSLTQEESPLYLLNEARPWLDPSKNPRRAAVSSFGFGGTNFHAVLEEYENEYRPWLKPSSLESCSSTLFVFSGSDRVSLGQEVKDFFEKVKGSEAPDVRALAYEALSEFSTEGAKLAFTAGDISELQSMLEKSCSWLEQAKGTCPPGLCFGEPVDSTGPVAVLFPGQGSQYPDMLREVSLAFPNAAAVLSEADDLLRPTFKNRFGEGATLSRFIFPRGAYSDFDREKAADRLRSTDVAQPALGAVCAASWKILSELGLKADMFAGHSYGEFTALYAAGALSLESLMRLSETRGRLIVDAARESGAELGTMAAVQATRIDVEAVLEAFQDVVVANHNAPLQSIISGSVEEVERIVEIFHDKGIEAQRIDVAAAFHSRFVEPARASLSQTIDEISFQPCSVPVYSNTTAAPHSDSIEMLAETMTDHLVRPVEFQTQIEQMYADGARLFVEIGPKRVLSGLVGRILGDERPHTVVALEGRGPGLRGLLDAVGQLVCAGVPMDLEKLFEGYRRTSEAEDSARSRRARVLKSPTAWLLNGSGARRISEAPKRVGLSWEEAQVREHALESPESQAPQSSSIEVEEGPDEQQETRRKAALKESKPEKIVDPDVMASYFEMMTQFVQSQETVMARYLESGNQAERSIPAEISRGGEGRLARRRSRAQARRASLQQGRSSPQPVAQGVLAPPPDAQASEPAPIMESDLGRETPIANGIAQSEPERLDDTWLSREAISAALLSLIEEKTGYPPEMVGVDQDLEAELGIDSIKRVEILGALLQQLPTGYGDRLGEERRDLNRKSTIAGMLDMLETLGGEESARPFDLAGAGSEVLIEHHLPRFEMKPQAEDLDPNGPRSLESGVFVVLAGLESPVAAALINGLGDLGRPVKRVSPEEVTSDEQAARIISQIYEEHGTVAGLLNLAALEAEWLTRETSNDRWRQELQRSQRGFFLLVAAGLHHTHSHAHVVSASGLGGLFGRGGSSPSGFSIQGGDVGFLKSLREERPELRVKAVDLDPSQESSVQAANILSELGVIGGRVEVGYPGGQRHVFRISESLSFIEGKGDVPHSVNLSRETVILATGGARGVTAESLRALAAPGATLVLTGRTPWSQEDSALSELKDEADLRTHFIGRVRAGELNWAPSEIRQEIQRILAMREMQANCQDFEKRGARVVYRAVDVTDEKALVEVVEEVSGTYGPIDTIVHGAGVIDDRAIMEKT
ncbi:MAG: SDR family NAD(P)-dependent oxidoreductase [Myxococcota bacterium]|nr:SDR family NAD(P)-dependent oxidoreductase [Myxococcota bacterium]